MMAEFEAFPKIPRLNRDITITEKLDGTNAAIIIEAALIPGGSPIFPGDIVVDDVVHSVTAQSRKRIITPESDNHGFAQWVRDNAVDLVRTLGPGRHFGEWWGLGIQRGYGQDRKVFSLFNPTFHFGVDSSGYYPRLVSEGYIRTVPVLYEGPFSQGEIDRAVERLRVQGSVAAPGFFNPEGIIIFHTASRGLFKVTCKNDEKPKGSTE